MPSVLGWIALYSIAVMTVSLLGGSVPFLGKVTHSRLQMYLSLSAGVMLGASFFHVMPDAMEMTGKIYFGWWVTLGVVGLFCIERFIAPHSHETSSKLQQEHAHEPGCEHDHEHRAAPPVAGWMAVVGLTIHTFMNGVGLAGAIQDDARKEMLVLPGLALFLAIILHKPADALAISTVLSRKGVSRGKVSLVQLGFAAMIPVGALGFYWTSGQLGAQLENKLIGAALAFSAGTFLFIALSDLLPEVQFHRHDRVPLFLALVAGVVLMGFIALLEPHEHGDDKHDSDSAGEVERGDKDANHHKDSSPRDNHDERADKH
jgi:zinc and cadmium transporter